MARKLEKDHITKMQAGRMKTRVQREEAQRVVAENSQFTSAAFWAGIDFELAAGVAAAIQKAQERRKAARIKELEAELAQLKAE